MSLEDQIASARRDYTMEATPERLTRLEHLLRRSGVLTMGDIRDANAQTVLRDVDAADFRVLTWLQRPADDGRSRVGWAIAEPGHEIPRWQSDADSLLLPGFFVPSDSDATIRDLLCLVLGELEEFEHEEISLCMVEWSAGDYEPLEEYEGPFSFFPSWQSRDQPCEPVIVEGPLWTVSASTEGVMISPVIAGHMAGTAPQRLGYAAKLGPDGDWGAFFPSPGQAREDLSETYGVCGHTGRDLGL